MRFSIVTPSFNQLDWLKLCIASVRDQIDSMPSTLDSGHSQFCVEHIVQDAGTSGIEEFAREQGAAFYRDGEKIFGRFGDTSDTGACQNNSQKVKYSLSIYAEKDSGMYDAINKGLARAQGDLCAYLNCDEQYLEGVLPWVADWFTKNPNIDIAFGNIIVTNESGNYICDRTAVIPNSWHILTGGSLSIFSAGTFFRRKVVSKGVMFDPSWRIIGDSIWMLSVMSAKLKKNLMQKKIASFVYSNQSLSQQPQAFEESRRLRAMASWPMRLLSRLMLACVRFQRLLLGGYAIKPHSYKIFTRDNPICRCEFQVLKTTHRWPSRP